LELRKFLNKDFISIIPARSGSKSIKDKNIKLFKGKPLLWWSINSSKNCKYIKSTIVSTDSKKYEKIAYKSGADIVLIRPKKISLDNSLDIDFIKHTIKNIDFDFKYILHLRPTTPIRNKHDLNKAMEIFKKNSNTSLRTVQEVSESSYKSYEIKNNRLLTIFNRDVNIDYSNFPRQNFPKTYVANGIADIYRKSFIEKNNKLFGNKVYAFVTKPTIEIDNGEDFNLLKKKYS
jgi:CMP-N,N'-diacetyllegionaminic acid synthase